MTEIVKDLHTTRHPLAFPNVIARLCEAVGVSYRASNSKEGVPKIRPIIAAVMENIRYPHHQPPPPPPQPQQYFGEGEHQEQPTYDAQMPQGYGWGKLQADMANLRTTQTEFYESILAQNASYGLRLQEIEVKQNDMCAEQNQFYKDVRAYQEQQKEYQKLQQEQFQQIQAEQAQIHQEFTNHVRDFSTRMDQVHTELEEEKARTLKIEGLAVGLSLDTRANDIYTHWGLQQCVPNFFPTNPESIPHKIRDNHKIGKPLLEGLILPTPPGESSAQKSKSTPKKK
ncbi:hypothetical protein PIB30_016649 [Stylosanthes scabra]|uniref:Uncharacterized protein n=1 Tax=Stylosanthes scabra TaxID=79078 RepID=A0ABU6WAF3_9FABA|nr:hypothetical protein [Stylosanthes scabra]